MISSRMTTKYKKNISGSNTVPTIKRQIEEVMNDLLNR